MPLGKTHLTLPNGRRVYTDDSGNFVTQQLISVGASDVGVGADDQTALIPTVFNGQKVSNDEAIRKIRKAKGMDPDTGMPVRVFQSVEDADVFARQESAGIGQLINAMLALSRRSY